jgi:hypothetical protein
MVQIPRYEDGTDSVCLLKRTLYRLQQSRQVWNKKLNAAFLKLGFKWLFADQCVYIRHTDQDLVIVAVHIDNMAIFSLDDTAMATIKKELAGYFTITDLGELKQIVGMEVKQDWECGTLKLSQSQYIKKILDIFGMADSHPVKMPLNPNVALTNTPEGVQHKLPEYRAAIGSLMYTAIGTKPEIAYAVQKLSQYTSNPSPKHWTAVKRVFHYLKGTQGLGIIYGTSNDSTEPVGYSNADWGSNSDNRKSISGHIFMLASGPISW